MGGGVECEARLRERLRCVRRTTVGGVVRRRSGLLGQAMGVVGRIGVWRVGGLVWGGRRLGLGRGLVVVGVRIGREVWFVWGWRGWGWGLGRGRGVRWRVGLGERGGTLEVL